MTARTHYTEQSKIEMEKFFIKLAVELIDKGFMHHDEDGSYSRMLMTVDNIYKLSEELRLTCGDHVLAW